METITETSFQKLRQVFASTVVLLDGEPVITCRARPLDIASFGALWTGQPRAAAQSEPD